MTIYELFQQLIRQFIELFQKLKNTKHEMARQNNKH
jgi:hypothetical protein